MALCNLHVLMTGKDGQGRTLLKVVLDNRDQASVAAGADGRPFTKNGRNLLRQTKTTSQGVGLLAAMKRTRAPRQFTFDQKDKERREANPRRQAEEMAEHAVSAG